MSVNITQRTGGCGRWIPCWVLLIVSEAALAGSPPHQAIDLVVDEAHLQQWPHSLSAAVLLPKVRANLSEWRYSMPLTGPYTHQLKAQIGLVSHQQTPVGFSFSSGNSDPRAVDFQKADVLPIRCQLTALGASRPLAEQQSTFSAHELSTTDRNRFIDKLTDKISTVCLSALENLPAVATEQSPDNTVFKPKWMPDIKVEVKQLPADIDKGTPSPVNTDEPKKVLIIHNQGTPVLLEMGHQRR